MSSFTRIIWEDNKIYLTSTSSSKFPVSGVKGNMSYKITNSFIAHLTGNVVKSKFDLNVVETRWKYFVFSKYFLADGVYCYDHSLEWGKFKQGLPPLSASLGSHYYILADDLCSDLGRTDLNILQQRMDKYSSGKIFINITVRSAGSLYSRRSIQIYLKWSICLFDLVYLLQWSCYRMAKFKSTELP